MLHLRYIIDDNREETTILDYECLTHALSEYNACRQYNEKHGIKQRLHITLPVYIGN